MPKRSAAKRKKKEIRPSAPSQQKQPRKSGPPQFFIDAADAVNSREYDRAIAVLKQGIGQDSFAAYKGIGDIHLILNENERAMEWLEKARECNPESVDVLESIGWALAGLGRKEEVVEKFSKAIKLQEDMENVRLLVKAMQQMGLTARAIEALKEAIGVDSPRPKVMFELAMFFEKIGQLDKAEEWCKKIVKLTPYPLAYNWLGILCHRTGRASEAVQYLQKTVELAPENMYAWTDLATFLLQSGDTQKGFELLRKAVDKAPDNSRIHANLLFYMHHLPDLDRQAIFEEHKRWGQRHAPISMAETSHNNTVEPERKLRIGYISPDFKRHAVAYYFEPLLDSHNRDVVEVYGYGNIDRPDPTTSRLQKKFDCYRSIRDVNDDAVARVIEQDKIDILIDLAGHTRNNRLLVLARKPAPIQVTYLGYPNTTGMTQVDYRLTDAIADTPDQQQYYTEKLVFLPNGFLCYNPGERQPTVKDLPMLHGDHITFGCFSNISKLNPVIIRIWIEILNRVPNSRLILKFAQGTDPQVRECYHNLFTEHGFENPEERIIISGWLQELEHLELYNNVDIGLDTYPYNGTTTTCQALLMGVPVITLVGSRHSSRVGLDIVTRLEMQFFAAQTPEEYVKKAVALASKPEALTQIRKTMRQRLAASPLCNCELIVNDIENAYRQMWRRWCRGQGVSVTIE